MDVFIEQIIQKHKELKHLLLTALVIVAIPVLTVVAFIFLQSFALFVFAGSIYGAYLVISGFSTEFEYSVTNNDLTVDKIIARRKRKRVISLDIKEIEAFGEYVPETQKSRTYQTRLYCGSHPMAPGQWYLEIRHKKLGHTLLVFEPEERVLEAIKPYLPRLVANDAFRRK